MNDIMLAKRHELSLYQVHTLTAIYQQMAGFMTADVPDLESLFTQYDATVDMQWSMSPYNQGAAHPWELANHPDYEYAIRVFEEESGVVVSLRSAVIEHILWQLKYSYRNGSRHHHLPYREVW